MLADHAEAQPCLALGNGGIHGGRNADAPLFQLVGQEPGVLVLADQHRQNRGFTGQADIQVTTAITSPRRIPLDTLIPIQLVVS